MENLVIVLHGHYTNEEQGLEYLGERQIAILAKRLKALFGKQTVLILSSKKKVAWQSAAIISAAFDDAPVEEQDVLLAPDTHLDTDENDFTDTLKLVLARQDSVDTIILVSHAEHIAEFPRCYGEAELKTFFPFFDEASEGSAVVIDCHDKTAELI